MSATMQMLVNERVGLFYWCRCGHRDVLDSGVMTRVLGGRFPVRATSLTIMCPKCGTIGPEVQPDWPSPGVVTRH